MRLIPIPGAAFTAAVFPHAQLSVTAGENSQPHSIRLHPAGIDEKSIAPQP
jgi:hypothetical protein